MATNPKIRLDEESEHDNCGPTPTLDIDTVTDVVSLNLFAFEAWETMFACESASSIYRDEILGGLSLYLSSLRDRNYKLKSFWLAGSSSEPKSIVATGDEYLLRITAEFQQLMETLAYLNANLLAYTGKSIADDCTSLAAAAWFNQHIGEFLDALPDLGKKVPRIFLLHRRGKSIKEIASTCSLTERKVKKHLRKIFEHFNWMLKRSLED